jgi:hypothetical protein
MEQVCNVCGHGEEDIEKDTEITVLLICDTCLRSEKLPPFLDKIFLN